MTKEEAVERLRNECCKSRLYCELYPDSCMKEECEIYMAIKALERTDTHECVDLISRQAALDAISTFGNREYRRKQGTLQDAFKLISALPSKNKSGKWIHKTGVYGVVYCSECDYELHSNNTNFCPNCGADMKGLGE